MAISNLNKPVYTFCSIAFIITICFLLSPEIIYPRILILRSPKHLLSHLSNTYKQQPCERSDIKKYFRISKQEVLGRLESNPRKLCNCQRISEVDDSQDSYTQSMCSDEVTLLGENQKVITFSLFSRAGSNWNETKARYFDGILDNLRLMKEYYPGWIMRVYTNLKFTPEVCDVVCSDDAIYFCNTEQLPYLGDVQSYHPMTWRFLALGDPTVRQFAVRDLDSRLNQREKDAVDEWEMSGFPIHGMRDHPWHGTQIMGGMWGADNNKLCLDVALGIQANILKADWMMNSLNDQQILTTVIYAPHSPKILTHDSFLCKIYKDSVPFPTQRPNDYDHVGRVYDEGNTNPLEKKCPLECRPSYGKSWEYC